MKMSSAPLRLDKYYEAPPSARKAAVMVLLLLAGDEPEVVFIKRPDHPKDPHSGQISFPGGRLEQEDDSYVSCALRETYEEIGIPTDDIHVIGPLSKLYVFASNNLVFPFVGYLDYKPKYRLQTSEVEKVISVPVRYFSSSEVCNKKEMRVKGHLLKDVPYYDLMGHTLWGATAMIFTEWLQIWEKNTL